MKYPVSSIDDVEQILAEYVPKPGQLFLNKLGLEKMWPLLKAAGEPHTKLKVVHIAGTSGKTSTTYYTTALLTERYARVGSTVSPHIDSITERVQINNQPLADEVFCSYFQRFMETVVSNIDNKPSYFELLIVFTLWVFVEEQVDFAVLETGLGGLYDSTNVVTREDKICILTDIGFDHQHVLGDTIEQIATQKAGIMHPGNIAFTYHQSEAVYGVFNEVAMQESAKLVIVNEVASGLLTTEFESLPRYQRRNWWLAFQVATYIFDIEKKDALTEREQARSMQTQVPARMENRKIDGKLVIMDGAHNEQKMQAFVLALQERYGEGARIPVLLALKNDKKYDDVLRQLEKVTKQLIITTFTVSQDMPIQAADPNKLAAIARQMSFEDITVCSDTKTALRILLESKEPVVAVTGSFYLISQLRNLTA